MKIEGSKIRILFDYVGKGLIIGKKHGEEQMQEVPTEKLGGFAIATADPSKPKGVKWIWADVVIDGDTVVVSSPDVQNPAHCRAIRVHHQSHGQQALQQGGPSCISFPHGRWGGIIKCEGNPL